MTNDQHHDSKDDGEEKIRDRMGSARDPSLPGVRGSDVAVKALRWLSHGRIPRGKLIEFCGDPCVFKTGIALDICARLTIGAPLFAKDSTQTRPPQKVLFFSAEDDVADTLLPRFLAAGGDPDLIQFVTAVHGLPTLPSDENKLKGWIKSWQPAFTVFDPIDAFLAPKTDPNSNPDARRVLLPLIRLGAQTGLTTALIRHLNKDSKLGRAMYRSAGSIGVTAASRASYIIAEKPGCPGRFVLACTKLNGAPKPPSLEYEIAEVVLDGVIKASTVKWLGETTESADDLVREPEPRQRGPSPEKRELAEAFLCKELADGAWHPSEPIIAAAKKAGIKYPTLKAALHALGGSYRKAAFRGGWDWALPSTPNNSQTSAKTNGQKHSTEDFFSEKNSQSSDRSDSPKSSLSSDKNLEDSEFPNDNSATSEKPFSPNHSDNSVDPENAEDSEFRGAPDDADLF